MNFKLPLFPIRTNVKCYQLAQSYQFIIPIVEYTVPRVVEKLVTEKPPIVEVEVIIGFLMVGPPTTHTDVFSNSGDS